MTWPVPDRKLLAWIGRRPYTARLVCAPGLWGMPGRDVRAFSARDSH